MYAPYITLVGDYKHCLHSGPVSVKGLTGEVTVLIRGGWVFGDREG